MEVVILPEPALAPTDALFRAGVERVVAKLGRAQPIPSGALPDDRAAMIAALDEWADGAVDWRGELRRYYEEHIPLHVRPSAAVNSALRHLREAGVRLAWWSPGPEEVTDVLLHHLGVARLVDDVVIGGSPAGVAGELGVEAHTTAIADGVEALVELSRRTAVRS